MIYLDNAATTKPFESVVRRMNVMLEDKFYNPSALYAPAFGVKKEVEAARDVICDALGGKGKLYFTACATESNSWVFASGIKNKKGNVVVSYGEHPSVFENARALIAKGIDVRFVGLNKDGSIDFDDFKQKVDENTALVSVIHCSNETGCINDIANLSAYLKSASPNAIFHSDGVQAFMKMPTNCADLGVDLYTISAHKIGGPKGIGGLWVRDGLNLAPFLIGGGQEQNLRSGTENTAGIVGFAQAVTEFEKTDKSKIAEYRLKFRTAFSGIPQVIINEGEQNSPYILSCSISGIKAEILQRLLAEKGVLIGLGSACASRSRKNRFLSAIGRSTSHIDGSVRISFSIQNLSDDMEHAQNEIITCIKKLLKS